jgi:hypothetical protein
MGGRRRRNPEPDSNVPPPIVFFVDLNEDDWESSQAAWRCSALRIPAIEVVELRRSDGEVCNEDRYEVDGSGHFVRWLGDTPPKAVTARMQVSQTLVTAHEAQAQENKTRRMGHIMSIVVASITAAGTYLAARGPAVATAQAAGAPTAAAVPLAAPSASSPTTRRKLEANVSFSTSGRAYQASYVSPTKPWIEQVALGYKPGAFTLSLFEDVAELECTCATTTHSSPSPAYVCATEARGPREILVQTTFNQRPSNEPFRIRCQARL